MEIRALTPAEQKYTYAQSMQLEGQTSNIGHLRGDFASLINVKELYVTVIKEPDAQTQSR